MENRIRVLIADGSEEFCCHLKNALQQLDGYDVVGTVNDGEQTVRLLGELHQKRARRTLVVRLARVRISSLLLHPNFRLEKMQLVSFLT